jgi:cobalamin-dependent methionine synthase I
LTDQDNVVDISRLYRLLDEDVPLNRIAKTLKVSWKRLQVMAEQYRAGQRAEEEAQRRQERAENRIEWMVSRARRSNLPITIDEHTREYLPKILRGDTFRGALEATAHCQPDGLPDPDYIRARAAA